MSRTRITQLTALAAMFAGAGLAHAQCIHDKLLPSNPEDQEFNFQAGAIRGDRIGLGRNDVQIGSDFNQGQAQFFVRQGVSWVSDGLVTGSDSDGGDHFGSSIDVWGESAVVGAPFHAVPGLPTFSEGAAYVFDWFLFGGWTQNIKLTAPTPVQSARFGHSVAMDGSWIVVGAPYEDTDTGDQAGAAYFYQKVGGNWQFKWRSLDTGAHVGDHYAYAVDIDGDYAVIGIPDFTVVSNPTCGTAVILKRNGTVWQIRDRVYPAITQDGEAFGDSVAISGDRIIVGGRLTTISPNPSAGTATIFKLNPATEEWELEQTLFSPDHVNQSYFGSSVSISGDRATVTSTYPEGITYVYERSGATWNLVDTLTDPDGGSGQFGWFAQVDGDQLLVNDVGDDTIVANNGAAYVYGLGANGQDACASALDVSVGTVYGCNGDATTDGSASCASSGKDVWYQFFVPCTGFYQIDTQGSDFDTVLSLHDGIGGCPAPIMACDDDSGIDNTSLIQRNLVKGQIIKIRVAGYRNFGFDAVGAFMLNVWELPPQNDDCSDAMAVSDGTTHFGTCAATTDGFGESLCTFFGDNQVNQDVWYTYTASCSGTATASLCGSDFDTKIAVYTGAGCPLFITNPIACNDDFCGTSSQVTFPVLAGDQYKIRIGGFTTHTGSGSLILSTTQTCPGDADGSSPVGVGDIAVVISNWGEPASGCSNGDLSGNGTVGLEDVAIIINNWTATCP